MTDKERADKAEAALAIVIRERDEANRLKVNYHNEIRALRGKRNVAAARAERLEAVLLSAWEWFDEERPQTSTGTLPLWWIDAHKLLSAAPSPRAETRETQDE